MSTLNIIFAGTPDFAAQHLQALLDSEHHVIAVYTQPAQLNNWLKNTKFQFINQNLYVKKKRKQS